MGLSRSQQMARIPGKNTTPEQLLRSALWRRGLRYRIHYKTPAGRPDVVFPRQKLAIFIDGCFWHGCPEHYVRPRSSSEFWARKLRENVERDHRQTLALERAGWVVLRFWEHEVFTEVDQCVARIESLLAGGEVRERSELRALRVDLVDAEKELERWTLVDLRSPDRELVEERVRSTRKW